MQLSPIVPKNAKIRIKAIQNKNKESPDRSNSKIKPWPLGSPNNQTLFENSPAILMMDNTLSTVDNK
jgi:hypothetical protein